MPAVHHLLLTKTIQIDQPYELTQDTRHLSRVIPAGTRLFKSKECDYGLANDDTRATGEDYVTMTTFPTGRRETSQDCPFGYSAFTIPVRLLRPIRDGRA
jgi:hypothetical protein